VLRRVFPTKRDELTVEYRRQHEIYALYSSLDIIRVIKSRRLRWAGHVARMGRGEVLTKFWLGNMWEGEPVGDPGVRGKVILKWIFEK
jgi:hypothetical protein